MKRYMIIMLIALGILFGGIFLYKLIMGIVFKHYFAANENQTVIVSTAKVEYAMWQPKLKGVGSVRAVNGVNVTTELAGMVKAIYFTPGTVVKAGKVLIQLNAGTQVGQLHALQAQAKLAKITYDRDRKQFAVQGVSKQQVDNDHYNLNNLIGQMAAQAETVKKLTIRAPFTGRLGIRQVNLGQYLNVGDTVVTLQSLDPIYMDFNLPQQALAQLKMGQSVNIVTDTFPDKKFVGKITTIMPLVDSSTRNVEVEATLANHDYSLTPGMYTTIEVDTGEEQPHLTLPQTAVVFNPYGNIVYVVKETGKGSDGKPILTANQVFVITGDTRGDQVMIISGLKEGETVVSSGQLKLKNGSRISINNTVELPNNPAPQVTNQHTG